MVVLDVLLHLKIYLVWYGHLTLVYNLHYLVSLIYCNKEDVLNLVASLDCTPIFEVETTWEETCMNGNELDEKHWFK